MLLERILRSTLIACVLVAVVYGLLRRSWAAAVAVLGGGFLITVSYSVIQLTVDAALASRGDGESRSRPTRWPLVKFFTRHAIVALAAYGMMVRLHLDPLGVLAGVSSLVIAVAVEVLRDLRWRRFP